MTANKVEWKDIEKYSERDVWTKYHLACTQLPRAFHLLQHNNQLDSPFSCASLSQLQLPLPDQIKTINNKACIPKTINKI